jgi:hypothetical protein
MADELDPRLEARLRDVLRHEAETLPFTLTLAEVEAAGRARHAPIARLRVPVALLASAAAVAIVVGGLIAWRGATLPPVGTESPNPLAGELESYEELAAGISLIDGLVIARGEELEGAPDGGERVIGTIPANAYVDIVFDCRGGGIEVGLRLDGEDGGRMSKPCDEAAEGFSSPGFARDGAEVFVRADPGTVWRLVVGGGTPSGPTPRPASLSALPSFEEIAAVASGFTEVARAEGDAQAEDTVVEILILGDLWNLELAWACIGDGLLVVGDTGSASKSSIGCGDGEPSASTMTLLDTAAERPTDAALVATVPAGVAWRLIVFDRSADIATGPVVPQAAFPVTVLTTFDGMLTPTAPHSEQVGPVAAGSTIEVAFGCSTGAFTPTDPPTLVRVTVDGVTSELACLKSNVAHFVPAGQRVEIGLATERTVDLALEVRAFTPAQAGAVVTAPSATLMSAEGTSKAQGFTTCLLAFAIPGGASADEGCGPTAYRIPDARTVRARAGERLALVPGIDWTITGAASITYLPSSEAGNLPPGEPAGHPAATRPGVEGDFSIAPLPVGDWTLRIEVAGTLVDGTTFTAEQLFRVIVEP